MIDAREFNETYKRFQYDDDALYAYSEEILGTGDWEKFLIKCFD